MIYDDVYMMYMMVYLFLILKKFDEFDDWSFFFVRCQYLDPPRVKMVPIKPHFTGGIWIEGLGNYEYYSFVTYDYGSLFKDQFKLMVSETSTTDPFKISSCVHVIIYCI